MSSFSLQSLKANSIRNISNLPGWRTSQKIVVIESDDWGSIRMPSQEAFRQLQQSGVNLTSGDSARYNGNDTLASARDLEALFDVLASFTDRNGHSAVFTPVSLVANPNFAKIKESGFEQYFYEPFTETLRRYKQEDAFGLWKEGIASKVFVPQFHGREHLNVMAWMRALKSGEKNVRAAFEQGCWGFNNQHPLGVSFQAAFDLEQASDLAYQQSVIREGLSLFQTLFGYKASFFVPPNGPFNNRLEGVAAEYGIRYMSASKVQHEALGAGKVRKQLHWLGQKNQFGQRYITRNCFFEPSQAGKDWVSACLQDMEIAFRWKKPAVISSHRVNYIGSLQESNRTHGLQQLRSLLSRIVKRWPEVEFLTSEQLGDRIAAAKA